MTTVKKLMEEQISNQRLLDDAEHYLTLATAAESPDMAAHYLEVSSANSLLVLARNSQSETIYAIDTDSGTLTINGKNMKQGRSSNDT